MKITDEECGVKKVKSLYNALKLELEKEPEIFVDFSAVRRVDLSVVQLIISAAREARLRGKTIKLKGVSDHVKQQFQTGGLNI
jgi:anti-anti-sigma regulatory factor